MDKFNVERKIEFYEDGNIEFYEDGKMEFYVHEIEFYVDGKIVSGPKMIQKLGNKLQVMQKTTLQILFSNSLLHLVFFMRYLFVSLYSFLFRDTSYILSKT